MKHNTIQHESDHQKSPCSKEHSFPNTPQKADPCNRLIKNFMWERHQSFNAEIHDWQNLTNPNIILNRAVYFSSQNISLSALHCAKNGNFETLQIISICIHDWLPELYFKTDFGEFNDKCYFCHNLPVIILNHSKPLDSHRSCSPTIPCRKKKAESFKYVIGT